MAEGARLESVYTATYRGFESPLTAIFKEEFVRKYGLFLYAVGMARIKRPNHMPGLLKIAKHQNQGIVAVALNP